MKEESRKKNCEIVELLTKNEFYKCKLDENELMLNDLKGRIKHLLEDNNVLYMQNSKLKHKENLNRHLHLCLKYYVYS